MTDLRLNDLEELRTLTIRYAHGVDSFNTDLVLTTFTTDAVLDHTSFGFSRSEGHDELRTYFTNLFQMATHLTHVITNHLIEFDGDDAAHGRNYVLAAMRTGEAEPTAQLLGYNDDTYVKTTTGWKINTRSTHPFFPLDS